MNCTLVDDFMCAENTLKEKVLKSVGRRSKSQKLTRLQTEVIFNVLSTHKMYKKNCRYRHLLHPCYLSAFDILQKAVYKCKSRNY